MRSASTCFQSAQRLAAQPRAAAEVTRKESNASAARRLQLVLDSAILNRTRRLGQLPEHLDAVGVDVGIPELPSESTTCDGSRNVVTAVARPQRRGAPDAACRRSSQRRRRRAPGTDRARSQSRTVVVEHDGVSERPAIVELKLAPKRERGVARCRTVLFLEREQIVEDAADQRTDVADVANLRLANNSGGRNASQITSPMSK